jgi:hypothetical protein
LFHRLCPATHQVLLHMPMQWEGSLIEQCNILSDLIYNNTNVKIENKKKIVFNVLKNFDCAYFINLLLPFIRSIFTSSEKIKLIDEVDNLITSLFPTFHDLFHLIDEIVNTCQPNIVLQLGQHIAENMVPSQLNQVINHCERNHAFFMGFCDHITKSNRKEILVKSLASGRIQFAKKYMKHNYFSGENFHFSGINVDTLPISIVYLLSRINCELAHQNFERKLYE